MEFIKKIKQFFKKEVKLEPTFPYSFHVKETKINKKGKQEIIPEAVEHNLLVRNHSNYKYWNEIVRMEELNESHIGVTFANNEGIFILEEPKKFINDPIEALSDLNITCSDIIKEIYGKNKARKRRRVSQTNNKKSKKRNSPKRSRNKISTKKLRIQSK